jgi:hypothetical protein
MTTQIAKNASNFTNRITTSHFLPFYDTTWPQLDLCEQTSHSIVLKMHVSVGNQVTATHKWEGITTVFTGFRVDKLQNTTFICFSWAQPDLASSQRCWHGRLRASFTLYTIPSLSYCKQLGLADFHARYHSLWQKLQCQHTKSLSKSCKQFCKTLLMTLSLLEWLTGRKITITVFWDMTLCNLVERNLLLRSPGPTLEMHAVSFCGTSVFI